MERMMKDLRDGETHIFANTREEYDAFVEWLTNNGATFAYHFESGEGYLRNGRVVVVYGL